MFVKMKVHFPVPHKQNIYSPGAQKEGHHGLSSEWVTKRLAVMQEICHCYITCVENLYSRAVSKQGEGHRNIGN